MYFKGRETALFSVALSSEHPGFLVPPNTVEKQYSLLIRGSSKYASKLSVQHDVLSALEDGKITL